MPQFSGSQISLQFLQGVSAIPTPPNNTIAHSIGLIPIFFSTPTMATPGGGFFVSGVDNQANAGISIPHHPPMMHLNPRCCFHIATSLPEENRAPHSQTEFPFQNPHLSHNNHVMFIRRPSPLLKSPSVDSESSDPAAGACYYRGGGGFCGSPVAAAAGPSGGGGGITFGIYLIYTFERIKYFFLIYVQN